MSDDTGLESAKPPAARRRISRTIIVVVLGVVLIGAVGVVGWTILRSRSDGAGRPVPAPRNMPAEQTSTPTTEESTVTVAPETGLPASSSTLPVTRKSFCAKEKVEIEKNINKIASLAKAIVLFIQQHF